MKLSALTFNMEGFSINLMAATIPVMIPAKRKPGISRGLRNISW